MAVELTTSLAGSSSIRSLVGGGPYDADGMRLGLDDDELSTCVACGLCLPHCPTYRVTGEEAYSPRGRIEAMRAVHWRGADADDAFVDFLETCVQCRGCEPACPSGVPYGRLVESARSALAAERRITPRWRRVAMWPLGRHRLLLAGSSLLALAQRVRLVPARLGLPRLPIRRGAPVVDTGDDVWLFTGCVMDAWQRDVHRDTARVLDALGVGHATARAGGDCCGALHVHAGLTDRARALAGRVMASMPGDAPILVNSAGCGAALADYGHLIGTDEAARFAARVLDVHTFVAEHLDELVVTRRVGGVIVQDPCHLRHVQRAHRAVYAVLSRVADVTELDDEGLCCGAGGAYATLQPELAGSIRDRKFESVDRAVAASGAAILASANPGCTLHLDAGCTERGLRIEHPMTLLASALGPMT